MAIGDAVVVVIRVLVVALAIIVVVRVLVVVLAVVVIIIVFIVSIAVVIVIVVVLIFVVRRITASARPGLFSVTPLLLLQMLATRAGAVRTYRVVVAVVLRVVAEEIPVILLFDVSTPM